MIRLSNLEERITSNDNIYITDNIDGGKFIPINFGGRLVNELGKQLLKAASEGDLEEIQKLLCEGAPFTADWLGTSPLHFAAQGNHLAVCETLVRAGISTNARTKVDRTPLHIAAYEGHLDIVNLLLKVETEIDCTDLLGMTPLHWAVQKEHCEVIETLLKFGARTDIINKFGLKPVDIAHQMNREDIIEILEEEQHEEPRIATENLAIEMAAEDENILDAEATNKDGNDDEVEVDAAPSDFRDDIQTIEINTNCEEQSDNSFSDSMRILREHGITLLPNDDDNNILSTVMESGHSVVLTDIGKQVLESVKASEEAEDISRKNLVENQERNDYITVTADQFLALAAGASISKEQTPIIRQVYGKFLPKTIKRIVMKKNKLQPISPVPNILKQKVLNQGTTVLHINQQPSDANEELESIRKQLAEANRTIEEYKQKLIRKEAEAESYKKQLNMLGFS